MPRDTPATLAPSLTWGCFVASIFLFFYHEKVFFDDYFKTGSDYGLVLGLTFGGFLLIAILGSKLPVKVIMGLLWGVLLTLALLWVLLGAALPKEPTDFGCLEPICQVPGQIALITLELGITPPLLLEYFRKTHQSLSQHTGFSAGMCTGLGLLVAGLLSLAGYYWTYLAHVGFSILTAIGVLSMSLREIPKQKKPVEQTQGASLYFGQGFRDLVVLAIVGVFGFSIMERDAYSFEQLIPFGIGFLVFAIVLHYGAPLWGEPRATAMLEGTTMGVFTLLVGFSVYMLNTNETVVLPIGIPPWVVGFAGAYLWHRLSLLLSGTRMRTAARKMHLQNMPIHFIRKFSFLLFLAGLFLLMAINIAPTGTDAPLILDAGLVIGAADFVIWIFIQFKIRSRETKPNSPV